MGYLDHKNNLNEKIMAKPLRLKEIPIKGRKIIIDNFELNGVKSTNDYILQGDKIYYSKKGQDRWFDVSDNNVARKNLLKFLYDRYDFRGYSNGERELYEKLFPSVTQAEPVKQDSPKQEEIVSTVSAPTFSAVHPWLSEPWSVQTQSDITPEQSEPVPYLYPSYRSEQLQQTFKNIGQQLSPQAIEQARRKSGEKPTGNNWFVNATIGAAAAENPYVMSTSLETDSSGNWGVRTTPTSQPSLKNVLIGLRDQLKIKNPGDIGSVWNMFIGGNYKDAKEVAANGADRKMELMQESNDLTTNLVIPGQFDETSEYAIRPQSIVGDTIWDVKPSGQWNSSNFYVKNKGRIYILPETLDVNDFTFGARNRGDYTPLTTEGAVITSMNDFRPYERRNKNFTNYIGIDPDGNFKIGTEEDFGPGDTMAGVIGNDIASFMKDKNGNYITSQSQASGNWKFDQPAYVLWDNGKLLPRPHGRNVNLLVPKDDPSGTSYGSVTGGRFIVKVGNEVRLLSGSLRDIDTQFEDMKKRNNAEYGTFYSLDNGTYNKGARTTDRRLTADDLRAYDNLNKGDKGYSGSFLYIKDRRQSPQVFRSDTIWTPNVRTVNDESYKKGHGLTNEQTGVVLHHTGFMSPDLTEVVDFLTRPGGNSSHVIIGYDGTRKVLARPDQVTFHAGHSVWNGRDNVNDFMIGIEFQGILINKILPSSKQLLQQNIQSL